MINCEFENGNQASLRHLGADCLVLKDGKILLVKRAAELLEGGKWGLVGGYAERGETIAQTAVREALEETGWEVKKLNLLTINDTPDRPGGDRQDVVFVFFCTAIKKVGEPDWESTEQRWFDLDDLPPDDQIAFDHADNIALYKRHISEKLLLPILHRDTY